MPTPTPITVDLLRSNPEKIQLIQGENIGRRLTFTITAGGVAVNLTGKTLILTGTQPDGSPVVLPMIISSATTGKAYCDVVSGLVSLAGDCTLQIRILTPAITGTATSGTSTSMYDTSKSWTVNAYIGSWLYINSGTGIGQARRITANTATQLTVSDAWGANPASGSGYSIMTETSFSFPILAYVTASPSVDAAIVGTGEFAALDVALASAAGYEAGKVPYVPNMSSSNKVQIVFGASDHGGLYYSSMVPLPFSDLYTITGLSLAVLNGGGQDVGTTLVVNKTKIGFSVSNNNAAVAGQAAFLNFTIAR